MTVMTGAKASFPGPSGGPERFLVAGLGVQGRKRLAICGQEAAVTVDPHVDEADYRDIADVPLGEFDAALVCTPDAAKMEILQYLLENGKHVLVEKPLLCDDARSYAKLEDLCRRKGVVCYTAYNHRFEPHFVRMRDLIESGRLGTLYSIRLFYGNGTARLVRESRWRDSGDGVLPDLGSHLLDTILFWTGKPAEPFVMQTARSHENAAYDHVVLGCDGEPVISLEMMLLSWRNDFHADVYGEHGSAHIRSLCKWGPSSFTHRTRKLPSGIPDEETVTLCQPDPTWRLEHRHFIAMCTDPNAHDYGNTRNDAWICDILASLAKSRVGAGSRHVAT